MIKKNLTLCLLIPVCLHLHAQRQNLPLNISFALGTQKQFKAKTTYTEEAILQCSWYAINMADVFANLSISNFYLSTQSLALSHYTWSLGAKVYTHETLNIFLQQRLKTKKQIPLTTWLEAGIGIKTSGHYYAYQINLGFGMAYYLNNYFSLKIQNNYHYVFKPIALSNTLQQNTLGSYTNINVGIVMDLFWNFKSEFEKINQRNKLQVGKDDFDIRKQYEGDLNTLKNIKKKKLSQKK